jgi:hypothetical protein
VNGNRSGYDPSKLHELKQLLFEWRNDLALHSSHHSKEPADQLYWQQKVAQIERRVLEVEWVLDRLEERGWRSSETVIFILVVAIALALALSGIAGLIW